MNVPEPLSQAARWALVVGLAFFSADATSALIGRTLNVPPKPLPQASVGVIQENVPAQAVPPGLIGLLKTTGSGDDTQGEGPGDGTAGPGSSVQPAPTQAPSNLQLKGTMAGGGGSGLAMIDVNGQTQVASTGEEVGGMILTSVSAYKITLTAKNGGVQVLEMNSDGPVAQAAPIGLPNPAPPAPQPEQTPEPEVDVAEGDDQGQGQEGAILTQRELRNILDNPAQFAGKGFRMKPVLNGGEIIGMRMNIRNTNHPLARLGIKDGDVVKSLNGTPLNGPEALSSIYRVLRNTSSLSFEVDRGGQSEKIEITLEE
jgi:type II secretion system protein C